MDTALRQKGQQKNHLRLVALMVSLAALLSSAGFGCARGPSPTADVAVELRLLSDRVVGPATAEVVLRTPEGRPMGSAEVWVRGDMSHAGMQPVLSRAKAVDAGRYVTDDFAFTMAGDWVLSVQATLPDGRTIDRVFSVAGVEAR